jgi:hypothetical protein
LSAAKSSYRRVLQVNGSYLPALIGLSDTEYESGNVAAATKGYKDIVDRFPEGSYPPRVKQRAEGKAPEPKATDAPSAPKAPKPGDPQ